MVRLSLQTFWRDRRGGAVVELGLIAPIIAGVILAIAEGAQYGLMVHDMRGAVSSGAQYVMGGASDPALVKAVSEAAWKSKPAAASVTVVQSYRCGATVVVTNTACAGTGLLPNRFFTVQAKSTFDNAFGTAPVTVKQVIRVR
ncbi:MAG: TadE/TadG family type IV pilus assembly protein [Caulobacteraceae bacterium]